VVHKEFVPQEQTVNAAFYKEVLARLVHNVKRRRLEIANRYKLHHDNATSYTAFLVTSYLVQIGVPTLPQPPYSPDVCPADFFLFLELKTAIKSHRFDDVDDIQRAVTNSLKGISEADY